VWLYHLLFRKTKQTLLVRYRLDYDKVTSRSTRLPRAVNAPLADQARGARRHEGGAGSDAAVEAVMQAALDLLRKHLPPALFAPASSSSSSSQQQQQQQQQRLTRIVLGASGFQVRTGWSGTRCGLVLIYP
jgi:hypothetical protein